MKINQFLMKHKGFRQFLVKTGVFVLTFSLLQILLSPLVLKTAIGSIMFLPFSLVDFAKAFLFTILLFFLLSRVKLFKLKESKFSLKDMSLFGALSLLSLAVYFLLRYYVKLNYPISSQLSYFGLVLLFTISILLFVLFLAVAIYSRKYLLQFFKNFKKELGISTVVLLVYYFLIVYVQKLWIYFSKAVAVLVYNLLHMTFSDVSVIYKSSPLISLNNFSASIGQPCSGVDSFLLFISLFLFILFLDWKIIHKKRMAIILLPGLVGMFFFNVFRIYLLYILGAFISKDFAIGMFHSNAGWLLFLGYFFVFWWFAYPWVKVEK